ncbi:hypothetical protein [Prosthecobacter sp.]|uniref:hypothetical protein n=1 Tax=Prosthecobacter sp. TaxID=1965333 RepID=UPI003783DC70
MTDSTQPFEALAFASHRNGSPIKLPRSRGEVVMLAFDRRQSRLVELHILTGETEAEERADQPSRLFKVIPASLLPRRKSSVLKQERRKPGSHRRKPARNAAPRRSSLQRFYAVNHVAAQPEVIPEAAPEEMREIHCELLREAAGIRGQSFMTIHEAGIDDGMAYYVTSLNDGEFVQDYVRRRGAVPTVTSLALVKQLLQDVGKAGDQARVVPGMRLDRVLVASPDDEHLQLRVFDYGLSQKRSSFSGENGSGRLVENACRLLFLLLTGQVFTGGNPESFTAIAELPANLRFIIKSVLASPKTHSISIKNLRDEVREALCLNVNLVQARNPKMLLGADSSTLPLSHLQKLLLGEIPLKTLFGASFRIENPAVAGCRPFAIPAFVVSTDQPVTLHLLPPERIVNEPDFMALPPQAWRYDPARQTNILNMLSLWNGPDWSFVSEVREPGMTLGGLMARRGTLNPGEVATLLRQIQAGLEQAVETGVHRADLDPASIHLCVGYDGPVLQRDLERLHQKRLDAWPKFVVKLRLHKTMRSLCKARQIDLSPWKSPPPEAGDSFTARDERHRTFIGLAAYLLTGEGQIREIAEFPASVPEAAAGYLLECLQAVMSGSMVPSPADFTEKLSQFLVSTSGDVFDEEAPPLDPSQMESAGFVSDFEEDWVSADSSLPERNKTELLAPVGDCLKTVDFNQAIPQSPRFSWLALAATFAILGVTAWMILGDLPSHHPEKPTAAVSSPPKESIRPQAVEEAAPQPKVIEPSPPLPQNVVPPAPAAIVAAVPAPPPVVAKEGTPEDHLVQKMPALELPKPQFVASVGPLSSIATQETEPVVVRRAIASTPPSAKPVSKGTKKAAAKPMHGLLRANAPIPLTHEAEMPKVSPPPAAPAPAVVAAPQKTPPPPAEAPAPAADAVTIRPAIVPTDEEIQQSLLQQAKSSTNKPDRR